MYPSRDFVVVLKVQHVSEPKLHHQVVNNMSLHHMTNNNMRLGYHKHANQI